MLVRYRNITVLLLAIFAQLLLLAYQVKSAEDVPLIRVWAVSAVTPLAKVLEVARSGTVGLVEGYITLHDTHQENQRMKSELDRLKMENQFLQSQLNTADRAKALVAFQAQTQSKTLAARIIALGAGFNSKVVFVDRGSTAGVEKGMAVVTPEGIVGKVLGAYPTASEVLLITDPNFAAGVISQKHHARGTLRGQGYADCKVDYIQNEEKVDIGELFFTTGDDRIFPKGFPVGAARVVRNGQGMKEIYVDPSGVQHGLEEVLILLQGVHQAIPEAPVASNEPIYMAPPPPAPAASGGLQDELGRSGAETDADRLRERYKQIGDAQNHKFGEGLPGSKPPDFNLRLPAAGAPPAAPPATSAVPKTATPGSAPEATGARPRTAPPAAPPAASAAPKPAAPKPAAPGSTPEATGAQPRTAPPQNKPPAPPPQQPVKPSKPVDPFL